MSQQAVTPYINVARIARTHGKKGEVVVVPLDGLPFCLRPGMRVCLTPPSLHGDRFHTVEHVGSGPTPLVRLSGVVGISEAEETVGKLVLALRDDVPEYVEERAVLDCVGHEMVDERAGSVGFVRELLQLPANDVWRVDGGPYGEFYVPVIDDVVTALPQDEGEPLRVRLLEGILPERKAEPCA